LSERNEAAEFAIDTAFMNLALAQADLAEAAGEVPVGAVVVMDGIVVGAGHNRLITDHDPTAHAEIVALRQASLALRNYRVPRATLYATLEPCAMCAGAMVHARIETLVFATREPRAGVARSRQHFFESAYLNHRVQVREGVCADASASRLQAFFRQRR